MEEGHKGHVDSRLHDVAGKEVWAMAKAMAGSHPGEDARGLVVPAL